jgi:3-hydroxybutyryl-CoA dehydratase
MAENRSPLAVGDFAQKDVVLSHEEVSRLASELGDTNPLHHDEAAAAASRFGGLIASGAHTTALLTAFCAAFTTSRVPVVGLEFSYQLRRAARAGDAYRMRWEVVAVERSHKLGGDVVTLAAEARDGEGRILVTGRGRVLAKEDL